jgi:hypothetical protein
MRSVRLAASLVIALSAIAFSAIGAARASAADTPVVAYSIASRGPVGADMATFAAAVRDAYGDPRGWSLGGAVRFRRVASGGDFTLWLAAPDAMASFSNDCSPSWSCRVGRDVVINDARFRSGSPYWVGTIDDYRILLINHETGHWLGFDHDSCPGSGALAPIMMQQSKGVGACVGNPWPLQGERIAAARKFGVAVTFLVADGLPRARGFEPLP